MTDQPTTPIRTVWTYKVNGEVMGTYNEAYVRDAYDTLTGINPAAHIQIVRLDHIPSDFATTGKNWTVVPTVVKDSHPKPVAEPKKSTAIDLLDPLRPCRRCNATGTFHLPNGPVPCRNCSGTGKVPSARDRRRIEAANRNYYRLIKIMRARAEERDGRRCGPIEFESHQGFGLLEQYEPHRLPALFRSLEDGRVDDVIDMLITYRNGHIAANKES